MVNQVSGWEAIFGTKGGKPKPTRAPRADPGCLATELEPDSEFDRLFDGDEGGGDEADHNCMEGVIADALGDWGVDVGAGAHGGGGF